MKTIYVKTTWIDNKTPVNAANMNKIENAIADLYSNALTASEITNGDGINVSITKDKAVEISVSNSVMKSETCDSVEVVVGDLDSYELRKLYLVLDSGTKKLKKIIMNGVNIYEVE